MPETIGRFEVVRRLGRSSSGSVYLASDPSLGRLLVIKIFDTDPSNEEQLSRIVSRLRDVARRLNHRNIPAIDDVGVHDGQPFVATEYIDGETLADVLTRTPPPPLVNRLAMAEQLCAGLAHAHAAGIVHGNIAPGEITIDRAGVLKIGDFAIPPAPATPATTGGQSAPRVNYLAPEQIEGGTFDHRADIFAIGAVLYELIALRRAFPGGVEVLHRILTEGPFPLIEAAPGVDDALVAIVERALARDPERRYQHADDIRRDIERVRVRLQQANDAQPAAGAPVPLPQVSVPTPPVAPAPRPDTIPPLSPRVEAAPRPGATVPPPPAPAAPAPRPRDTVPAPPSDMAPAGPSGVPTGHSPRPPVQPEPVREAEAPSRERAPEEAAAPADNALKPAVPVDDVQFTVYRPRAVRPERQTPMLVYTHLGDARDPRAPRPIEQVRERAQAVLGPAASAFRDSTTDSRHAIPAGGEITLLPEIPGVTFTPERHVFRWTADIHEHRFEVNAGRQLDGHVARGQLTVYLGVVLLAEVPLAIRVDSTAAEQPDNDRSTARPFRKIFASYSRRDEAIVEQFERYVEALGDRYLRDVRNLRAGERWEDGLRRLIEEADVFQLFWSWNAMRSPNVRREWEYAISLNRPAFVRPTYWEMPLPEAPEENLPPPALRQLHFHCMAPAIVAESSSPVRGDDRAATAPSRHETDSTGSAPIAFPTPISPPPGHPEPGPVRTSPPVRRMPAFRPARVAGVAASLVLAAVVATLVLPTGSEPPSPTATRPEDSPPASASPPPTVIARGGADPAEQAATGSRGQPPSRGARGAPPVATVTVPPADVAAVRSVLSRLAEAYRARDPASVRRLWPSAPRELDDSLTSARSYQVDILDPQISISGARATAIASRRVRIVTAAGRVQQSTERVTFTLERTPDGWVVAGVR